MLSSLVKGEDEVKIIQYSWLSKGGGSIVVVYMDKIICMVIEIAPKKQILNKETY